MRNKILRNFAWLMAHPYKNAITIVSGRKIGRNEYCPCGSKMKYKYCCLRKG